MFYTLKQLYSEMREPVFVPATSSASFSILTIIADLLTSFVMFSSGYSIALSHISGFIAAGLLLILCRLIGIDKSATAFTGVKNIKKILLIAIYALLQIAIRGGCIASLSNLGMTDSFAMGLGILMSVLLAGYSSNLLFSMSGSRSENKPEKGCSDSLNWLAVSITLAICAFALRLVYLNALEVIPQEAYYWNYAQHLSPGYLDHPPLVATTIYLGEMLFGHNLFGSRVGAFFYGFIFIAFFYRYARLQVDKTSAVLATSFALLLPYYFLGSGFLITPDAGLAMAWVMAVYFFYKALVTDDKKAWYGVGVAMGIGMLSKYSIALLAPAAFLYIVIDAQARQHLFKKEPYIAIVIAVLIFSPVIYWNIINDWASFEFQAIDRFDKAPEFSLHVMLENILAMVTPLPLLALPYLFIKKIFREDKTQKSILESPFNVRVRFFIASFLLLPLSVFAWSALKSEPRYNWTGPLWVTILPMLAWLVINAGQLRWRLLAVLLNKLALPLLFVLVGVYSILLHSLSIGLPGLAFPYGTARLLGWQEVSRNILAIQKKLPVNDARVIVTGMDKYFISSKLAYYGTDEYLGKNNKLQVTGTQIVGGDSLMFAYWNPVDQYKGDTVIMLSRDKFELRTGRLKPYFEKISPGMSVFPVYKDDYGLPKETIREYYYRVGFGYKPPQP